jgi:hypothetical protein
MKKGVLAFLLGLLTTIAYSQTQDPESPGFDFPTDSTQIPIDPNESSEEAQEAPVVKPYERITLNVDSVTNLISYLGVVEQEESGSDSLYTRAKRWALKVFSDGKSPISTDKKNQKLVFNGYLPAFAYGNRYTKRDIGRFEFKMTVWIKEGRYRYQITNLVHESIKPAQGDPTRNYFEYYYTATNNVKGFDVLLRYADKDLNKLIEDFKKNMRDPIIVDEEDW